MFAKTNPAEEYALALAQGVQSTAILSHLKRRANGYLLLKKVEA